MCLSQVNDDELDAKSPTLLYPNIQGDYLLGADVFECKIRQYAVHQTIAEMIWRLMKFRAWLVLLNTH